MKEKMKEKVAVGIAISIFGICQWLLGYVAGYASGESETVKKNLEEPGRNKETDQLESVQEKVCNH